MKYEHAFSLSIICCVIALLSLFITRLYAAGNEYTVLASYKDSITKLLIQNKYSGTILIADGNKILYGTGVGYADDDKKEINDRYTTYPLFSLTKQFTAVAIVQLCNTGKMSMTDTVAMYFPEYSAGSKITIKQLLEMTSGIPDYISTPTMQKLLKQQSFDPEMTQQKILEAIFSQQLAFIPGTKTQYSNSNYYVLGAILEKVTDRAYDYYIRTRLLVPNGIIKYAFSPERAQAIGYSGKENIPVTEYAGELTGGAGCIVTSIVDLFTWELALFGNKIPNCNIYDQFANGQGYSCGMKFDGQKFYHEGRGHVFRNGMYYYPDKSIYILLLSNHSDTDVHQLQKTIYEKTVRILKKINT